MPTYELALVLRTMPRTELISTLKRTAQAIFDRAGIIRKIDNLGTRDIPYKTSVHGIVHRQGSYFMMEFDIPPTALADLTEGYGRDIDIIRRRIFRKLEPVTQECTLHEQLLPPAYRKEVQQMIIQAKKNEKPKYNHHTGLDYYPFQK